MNDTSLPAPFADLEPYVAQWAMPDEKTRAIKRLSSDMETLKRFHAATAPRIEEIICFLNAYPNTPHDLPPEVGRLFRLAQMIMEASAPIDLQWDSPNMEDVFPYERMRFHAVSGS
ncbi:hypothetical protein PIGHUM_00535 [Pigmentiphaga humi]|uniref:Uncharacterized protein n=1 Tax=Pigmentiphaga humi TaxID=2478468 RepID=A0A3P4AWP7_9BURK|nr:hypothetical protein [Pigmentiphaga humi]VCU68484.1 hypothetical protein PIGHUM_00535 [Pigmentiphaga humi]